MKKPLIYKILLPFAKFRYRKMRIVYDDPSDPSPAVFVANHARIDGPAATTVHSEIPSAAAMPLLLCATFIGLDDGLPYE